MAKELPYFRFTCQEWQNGDITLEPMATQGLFINICSYYWLNNCTLSYEKVTKKYKRCARTLQRLHALGILEVNSEVVSINFLDRQWEELQSFREKKRIAGQKGGKKKASNATAQLKQNPSYKEKDKDKENYKDNTKAVGEIVDYLNQVTGSHYKKTSNLTKGLIKSRLNDGFTMDNFKTVIFKKSSEWKGTEREKFIRPETLFSNKFEGYLNQTGNFNQEKSHAEREDDRIGDYLKDIGITPKESNFNQIDE